MENKFRGQRTDNKKWVYGYYFKTPLTDEATNSKPEDGWSFLSGRERHCIAQNSCVYEVIPETVGQFLGVLNNKEVYEGDYLSVNGYCYEEPEEDWCGVISRGLFGWCLDGFNSNGDEQWYPLYEIGGSYITIYKLLGNIHDNPELLEGDD